MASPKVHSVLSAPHIEHLLEALDAATDDGWKYLDSFQEHGVTKILLFKELDV